MKVIWVRLARAACYLGYMKAWPPVIHNGVVFQIPRRIKIERPESEQLLHLAYIIYSVLLHITKAFEKKAETLIFILGHPSFALGLQPSLLFAFLQHETQEPLTPQPICQVSSDVSSVWGGCSTQVTQPDFPEDSKQVCLIHSL